MGKPAALLKLSTQFGYVDAQYVTLLQHTEEEEKQAWSARNLHVVRTGSAWPAHAEQKHGKRQDSTVLRLLSCVIQQGPARFGKPVSSSFPLVADYGTFFGPDAVHFWSTTSVCHVAILRRRGEERPGSKTRDLRLECFEKHAPA